MRFKATIINAELLCRIVKSVDKIGKEGILLLTLTDVQFIVAADVVDGVQVWTTVPVQTLCDNYRVESMNNNEIALQLNLGHLERVLQSAGTAQPVAVRLTKRNRDPILTLSVEQSHLNRVALTQEVPVVPLTAKQRARYIEPDLPDPQVAICMPSLRHVQTVVDRMKSLSDTIIIEANMAGELTLRIDADMVQVTTFYKNLEHPEFDGKTPPTRDPSVSARVRVDAKKLLKFLSSYRVHPINVVCCLVEGRAAVFHVGVDQLYMTYYLPVQT